MDEKKKERETREDGGKEKDKKQEKPKRKTSDASNHPIKPQEQLKITIFAKNFKF